MGVGEAVDGPVKSDASTHGLRKSIVRPTLHEVAEQATEQSFPGWLGEVQVGQIVHPRLLN